jgi:cysteinyl-tRNA synthetase
MWLKVFNTLRGEKENFFPLMESEAEISVSGVAVYDPSHRTIRRKTNLA